jgi:hypothetical protein
MRNRMQHQKAKKKKTLSKYNMRSEFFIYTYNEYQLIGKINPAD